MARRYDLKPIKRSHAERDPYGKRIFRNYSPPTDDALISSLTPDQAQAFVDAVETGKTDARMPAWAALPGMPPDRRVKRLAKIIKERASSA